MKKNLIAIILIIPLLVVFFVYKQLGHKLNVKVDAPDDQSCLVYQILMGVFGTVSIASAASGLILYADLKMKIDELQKINNEIKELEQKKGKLITANKTASEEIAIFRLISEGQRKVINSLENENHNFSQTVKELKRNIEERLKDIDELLSQVLSITKDSLQKLLQIEELKKENKQINTTSLTYQEMYKTLYSYAAALENEIVRINDIIKGLNKKIKELEEYIKEIIKKNEKLKSEITQFGDIVKENNATIGNLLTEADDLNNEVQNLSIEILIEKELRSISEMILNVDYTELKSMSKSDRNKAFALAAEDISNIFLYAAAGLKVK